MWKPSERIKFKAEPKAWPTEVEARGSKLFSPIEYGTLNLVNRTWVPAMVPWRATAEGEVTRDVIDWYARFAEGRPGAIVVEATGVRDVPSGPLLRIGHERFLPGLKAVVDAVREASQGQTRLYIQLIDFLAVRRRPKRDAFLRRFLRLTDEHYDAAGSQDETVVRDYLLGLDDEALKPLLSDRDWDSMTRGYRERVTDVDLDHIQNLPQTLPRLFADAAERAQRAGFDGVELHYAHAYTMASFLSALNTRTDGYGTNREGRLRLPLEVYNAVRRCVGADYTVGCRMLSEDCIEGGSSLADAMEFARAFAKAGMDFISLSRGGKFDDALQPNIGQAIYPYTGPSGYECMPHFISDSQGPFGRNIEPTAHIRHAIRQDNLQTPIVVAGGIHDFYQAEGILDAGDADIIGIARQALADPDWFRKVATGHGSAVNVCKYSNYCEGLDQKHKMVTCQLWDRVSLDEPDLALTPDKKRRTVAPSWSFKDSAPNSQKG